MTIKDEFNHLEMLSGKKQNSGRIVKTKTGLTGRIYNHEDLINGKIRVYIDNVKLLCDPSTLKVIGFFD